MPNIAVLITVAAVMFAVLGAITLIAHIYKLNNIKSKSCGFPPAARTDRPLLVTVARVGLSKTRVLQSRVTIYRFQASRMALFIV